MPVEFIEDHKAAIALALVGLLFVGFLREKLPPSVIALSGAAAFMALGFTPVEDALSVFSNPAPIASWYSAARARSHVVVGPAGTGSASAVNWLRSRWRKNQ
jgi:hypothetical protein